ncbi:hypothetical protein [Sphingomonas sp.]|uniref:hypothetical protein n=1 Tax=Sphingomonas sp. TaxID=28214 RepID=UPI003BADA7A2
MQDGRVKQVMAPVPRADRRRWHERASRLVLASAGIASLLAVSALIGRLDELAFGILLYLLGLAAVLRLMLAQPVQCDDISENSNDPTDLMWMGRKAPRP